MDEPPWNGLMAILQGPQGTDPPPCCQAYRVLAAQKREARVGCLLRLWGRVVTVAFADYFHSVVVLALQDADTQCNALRFLGHCAEHLPRSDLKNFLQRFCKDSEQLTAVVLARRLLQGLEEADVPPLLDHRTATAPSFVGSSMVGVTDPMVMSSLEENIFDEAKDREVISQQSQADDVHLFSQVDETTTSTNSIQPRNGLSVTVESSLREARKKLLALSTSMGPGELRQAPALQELVDTLQGVDDEMVSKALQTVDLPTLPDVVFCTVCEILYQDDLSYVRCLALSSTSLLPKCQALDRPASRQLFGLVQSVVAANSNAAVDGFLLPLLADVPGFGTAQCELVNRVVKSSLSEDGVVKLLRSLLRLSAASRIADYRSDMNGSLPMSLQLQSPYTWSEFTVKVIDAMLARRPKLDELLIDRLITQFSRAASQLSESRKFAATVFSFVVKFGKSCSSAHVTVLEGISSQLASFMRKAVQRALKKLKAK